MSLLRNSKSAEKLEPQSKIRCKSTENPHPVSKSKGKSTENRNTKVKVEVKVPFFRGQKYRGIFGQRTFI